MPSLLFLSPVFPYPIDRGQRGRVANILRACSEVCCVTYVGPPPDRPEDADVPALDGIRTIYTDPVCAGGNISSIDLWRNALATREFVRKERLAGLAPYTAAMSILNPGDFDLIFVERRNLAVLVPGQRHKTIVDLDDVEHLKHFREIQQARSPLDMARMVPRGLRLLIRETIGLRGYLGCAVCSEEDRSYLERFGLRNVFVLPNGTELDARVRNAVEPTPSGDGVFVGNMSYAPNVDALEYFQDNILPLIRRDRPNFRLHVIGNSAGMEARFVDGFVFHGFVPDLQAALAPHSVCLVPLRLGGGTKTKVIDAMAAGIPLVTTSVGAEGLEIEHGRHALVADDPADFAANALAVLDNEEIAARLANEALASIRSRFAWVNIREDFSKKLRSLIADDPRSSSAGKAA